MAMTDAQRIEQLLAGQEHRIRRAFLQFVRMAESEVAMKEIIRRLERGDIDGALLVVDSHVARMGDLLPAIAATVGQATAAELAALAPNIAIAISFDPSFPRAAELIRSNRARFVREITQGQRQAILRALSRAYREGAGTAEAARAFRGAIGLTAYQEQVLANYRNSLMTRSSDALSRALRDRRFDRTVRRAIELDEPLSPDQIDKMTEASRRKMLAMRADNIARTEGVRATNEAREEASRQMMDQIGLDPAKFKRKWNATMDRRVRDFHASMNGQLRGKDEPFRDGHGNLLRYPGDPKAPAETTINCRCTLTFQVDFNA